MNWNFVIEEEKWKEDMENEKLPDEATLYIRGKDWKVVMDLESFEEVSLEDASSYTFFAKQRYGPKYIYLETLAEYMPNVSSSVECREADNYVNYWATLLNDLGEGSTPQNKIKEEEHNGMPI